jgi:CMP-N-acetylneuraminic acid synthetase
MRVLGLVPARAGSKGVPAKNTRLLGGRPLLAYTAEVALAARQLARVVLSTEDETIAALGTDLGLEVPFLRPPELAGDDTPMLAVLQHAIDSLPEAFDAVCLLQPTSPLRPAGLIDRCITLLDSSGADAVVTMVPVPAEHNPHWVYVRDAGGRLRLSTGEANPIGRRQDLPTALHRDGSVYVLRTEGIRRGIPYGDHLEAVVLEPATSVNIDDLDDWARAEALLESEHPV